MKCDYCQQEIEVGSAHIFQTSVGNFCNHICNENWWEHQKKVYKKSDRVSSEGKEIYLTPEREKFEEIKRMAFALFGQNDYELKCAWEWAEEFYNFAKEKEKEMQNGE